MSELEDRQPNTPLPGSGSVFGYFLRVQPIRLLKQHTR